MSNVKNYKKGQTLFYLGKTRSTVIHNTLKAGGVNADEAVLFLRTVQGTCIAIPVAEQELFVSETQLPFLQKWQIKPIPTV